MSLDIHAGFSGKTLFLTGGTGFVGKVAIFKILKEFPDIRTIYLLARGKKSRRHNRFLNAQERLDLEVMGSPCFEPLRTQVGDAKWTELCGKVKAVRGDITEDHLGLSESDRAMIANEVNMIVHMAATINFTERLDLAVQMNSLGSLRVLALAKTCKHLEAMVHVSTCYVNYHRQGRELPAEEKLYPLPFDPEDMCKHILALHTSEVDNESARLLKQYKYPNTYTFTKTMAEQLLYRYKEDVPMVIVRPSIVGCSYLEPFPGWVDVLTAAGGIILTGSLGVVRELMCNPSNTADIVPVDFVINVILKALFRAQVYYKSARSSTPTATAAAADKAVTSYPVILPNTPVLPQWSEVKGSASGHSMNAYVATSATKTTATNSAVASRSDLPEAATLPSLPFIYQASTSSSENRLEWRRMTEAVREYMNSARQHPKALSLPDVVLTPSRLRYAYRYAKRYVPYLMLLTLVHLPEPIGSEKKRQLVAKLGKALRRADMLNDQFQDFTLVEWFFSSTNSRSLDEGLNERSRHAFPFDPYMINWYSYSQLYTFGILKHIVRETGGYTCPPTPQSATTIFMRASAL